MCAGGGDGAETVEIDRVMRGESRSSWRSGRHCLLQLGRMNADSSPVPSGLADR